MIMKITTAAKIYDVGDPQLWKLRSLGFKFHTARESGYAKGDPRARIQYHLNKDQNVQISILEIEDLMKLVKRFGSIIIKENELEIYNDYRE